MAVVLVAVAEDEEEEEGETGRDSLILVFQVGSTTTCLIVDGTPSYPQETIPSDRNRYYLGLYVASILRYSTLRLYYHTVTACYYADCHARREYVDATNGK